MATKDEEEKTRRDAQASGRRRGHSGPPQSPGPPQSETRPSEEAARSESDAARQSQRAEPGEEPAIVKEERPVTTQDQSGRATAGQSARPVTAGARDEFLISTLPAAVRSFWQAPVTTAPAIELDALADQLQGAD